MRILAIGAHPDDLEIHCFGTLAMHVKKGDEVFVCGVTNGNMGHMTIPPEELGKIRIKEATEAAKIIGAKEYINLEVGDLMVRSDDEELSMKMIDVVRYVRPDYIITHRTDEYHRDHNETGALAFHTSFSASCPGLKTKEPVFLKVPSIYYMESSSPAFQATDYVDISDVIELKTNALACHQSQVEWLAEHDGEDVIAQMKRKAAVHGTECGVQYAETFQRCMQGCRISPGRLLP